MSDEKSGARVMTGLSLVALVSIGFGIAAYLLNVEQNRCEMTYMYEIPEYIPVPLTSSAGTKEEANVHHSRYRLFVYGEGVYAEQLKSELRYNKMTGVPVLFIPGSGGSHAQVRSLASVLLRKSEHLRSKVQFNVFAVDFGADFSALDGALLAKQTDFVVRCLRRISHLYPQRTENSQGAGIIVYGHSMGGVVAVMANKVLESKGKHDTVAPLVLTYASPFSRPVVFVDPYLQETYETLFEDLPKNTFLVSVGGGFRDYLVPSHLTVANLSQSSETAVMTNTMSMPLTWASTDHRCIVWCRQVVLASARALFDLVDSQTKRMTADKALIGSVARKHFAAQNQVPYLPSLETFGSSSGSHPSRAQVLQDSLSTKSSNGHSIKVAYPKEKPTGSILLVIEHNWPGDVEIYAESGKADQQDTRKPLAEASSLLLPPLYSNKKLTTFRLNRESFNVDSLEIAFKPTKSSSSVKLTWVVDWVTSSDVFHANFPTMGSAFLSFFAPVTVAKDVKGRLLSQIVFDGFDSPYSAAALKLVPTSCPTQTKLSSSTLNGSLAIFHNADNVDEAYEYALYGHAITLPIRKQVSVPLSNTSLPRVSIVLDPMCTYDVEIKWSMPDVSAQYIRFALHILPSILGLVLVAFVMSTLKSLDTPAETNVMQFIFFQCKPVSIVAVSKIIQMILSRFAHLLPFAFDFDIIASEGDNILFGTLPLILYFFVLGFIGVYVQLLTIIFCAIGRPFSSICSWLLRPSLYLAILMHLAAVASALVFSSALGLAIVYLSFLIPLFCFSATRVSWQLQRFVMSLALLSLWVALVAGPTLLHQFYLPASNGFVPNQYKPAFASIDGSSHFDQWLQQSAICFAVGAALFTVSIIVQLGQGQSPSTADPTLEKAAIVAPRLLQFGAIATFLFASRSLYRAPAIVSFAFMLAGLSHLVIMHRKSNNKSQKSSKRPKTD